MAKQSKIQKNFKKQMERSEKELNRKAKRGEGVLSNKLYRLRFYGYYDDEKSTEGVGKKTFRSIFKIIKFIITIFVLFCVTIVIIAIAATVNNK